MCINLHTNPLSTLFNDYNSQRDKTFNTPSDLSKLIDPRIEIDKWMIKDFIPPPCTAVHVHTAYSWGAKVLTAHISNLQKSNKTGKNAISEELLLAALIAKTSQNVVHKQDLKCNPADKTINEKFVSSGLLKRLIAQENVSNTLMRAIIQNNISRFEAVIEQYPEEFKAAVTKKDAMGLTPAFSAVAFGKNVYKYLSLIAETAAEEFKTALTMQDNLGYTLISLLVMEKAWEIIEFLAKFAQTEFSKSLTLINDEGNTPVALAVINQDLKMLKIMFKYAPDEFKLALSMQNEEGDTPLSLAYFRADILKYINQVAPQSFQLASDTRDNWGFSILDLVKRGRPKNYQEITKLFDKNSLIKRTNKEIFNRKALSHFFGLSGTSYVTQSCTGQVLAKIKLEGWYSPQWFNLIEKDLHLFQKEYPLSLSDNDMDILQKACRFEADNSSYSRKQSFKAIKSGTGAAFVSTGYLQHEVTLLLLIKEGWLGICNRGESSRGAVEFFRFNPQKFNFEIYNKIVNVQNGTKEDYQKLFFNELPEKLELVKTDLARQLEKNILKLPYKANVTDKTKVNEIVVLPDQTIGNCTVVSPITALYAYRLMLEFKDLEKPPNDINERRLNVVDWFHTWLSFEQLLILERNIKPFENLDPYFKPDHKLILESLRKAYSLNLDGKSSLKLHALTKIYQDYIHPAARKNLINNLAKWKKAEKKLQL